MLVIGVFAALDQLRVAPTITTGMFHAPLAVVAGSAKLAALPQNSAEVLADSD